MVLRGVSLDLFDTLVDLAMEDLPRFELAGKERRGTTAELHAALDASAGVSLEVFHEALREVDRGHRRVRYGEGREIGTLDRFREVAERLALDDPELPQRWTDIHMGRLRALAATPAHHAGLLVRLRETARVGICSNFTHGAPARRLLAEDGLAPHLDAVVISEDVGMRKPRAEIFDAVLDGLGTAPEETLHVGDNLDADVAGAAARGLRTVWLTRRVADPDAALRAHRGPAPDFIVADLGELPALLAEAR